jgi:hypothetical protein
MFREKGIDITNNQVNFVQQDRTPISNAPPRQEMRGPQGDINDLLSGLKIKSSQQQQPTSSDYSLPMVNEHDGESIISANSLRDIQSTDAPKRSGRRRQKSDRNTISLDI